MNLSDRVAIEIALYSKKTFKQMAEKLGRHPSTIAREIKENRTFIQENYPLGNDCRNVRHFTMMHLCKSKMPYCSTKCKMCREFDCRQICISYESSACKKYESPPYVCNSCKDKRICICPINRVLIIRHIFS